MGSREERQEHRHFLGLSGARQVGGLAADGRSRGQCRRCGGRLHEAESTRPPDRHREGTSNRGERRFRWRSSGARRNRRAATGSPGADPVRTTHSQLADLLRLRRRIVCTVSGPLSGVHGRSLRMIEACVSAGQRRAEPPCHRTKIRYDLAILNKTRPRAQRCASGLFLPA